MALLEVEALTTHLVLPGRTVRAVDGVSFGIERGETVGLVGESGCGKSMTGASILRLLPEGGGIVSGSVRLDGRDLTALSESAMARVRGNQIGMVFQDPLTALNPTMSIGEQVAESLLIHRAVPKAGIRSRTLELLDMVGVPRPTERISSYPHQLSGGLRQRVCIAIALACQPSLLIADEPTTALDVSIQDQILSLLQRLKRELSMAVLLITHDMGVIAEHTDRVLVMYAGQIIESTSRSALFTQPRHPYTEALLAAVPTVTTGARTVLATIPGAPPDLANPAAHCRFVPRCRYPTAECSERMPALRSDADGQAYACFHPRPPAGDEPAPCPPGPRWAPCPPGPRSRSSRRNGSRPRARARAVARARQRCQGIPGTERLHPPGRRVGQGGVRRLAHREPRRDLRPGGRVRMRQDDDRPAHGRAGEAGLRNGHGTGPRGRPDRAEGPAAPAPRPADGLPGPVFVAGPEDARAVHSRRAPGGAADVHQIRAGPAGRPAARRGGPAGAAPAGSCRGSSPAASGSGSASPARLPSARC